MPDVFSQVWALDGLVWLIAAAFVAGTVRGFSGFGTAMIYLPIAAQVIDPIWCIATLAVMDIFGPLPNMPSALRNGHPRDLVRLGIAVVVTIPIGLIVLFAIDPAVFRVAVALISLALLACLVGGVRYKGEVTRSMVFGIGGAAGLLGGATGTPGPPVILFYMARPIPASAIRANVMAFLFFYDAIVLVMLALRGALTASIVALGLVLAVPNVLGNLLGAAIFRPERERAYKIVAYLIIAASALSALPIW
ncbi:sulfite exporter TauE/SafE family protein [Shimia biformata]|uniref:sulfite exporter TauE/SafE family protein n=1 Tax=Shimia biformata TaxID=1294299 RepID=UPI00194E0A95|nr:sulfite exporter TauE/SafE family protein [Shimia biformata]